MSQISITWHGHSCYSVTADDYTIVLDPYEPGSVPGLRDLALTANQVLCSHGHHDHGYTDAVTVTEKADSPFTIRTIDSWHDDAEGTKRGPNRIHILEAHGMRIVHFGDQGCMPTPEQLDELKLADAAMVPIGGFYTIDSVAAAELMMAINPTVIIPMHYRSETFGFPVLGCLEDYTAGGDDVVHYGVPTLTLENGMKKQIAVLVPEMA